MIKPFLILGIASVAVSLALIVPKQVHAAATTDYLEVADFDDLQALTPAKRAAYIGHMRDLLVDLAETDAGSDYEFFSGNSMHFTASMAGWQKGYLVFLKAMESPAFAADDEVALKKVKLSDIKCPGKFNKAVALYKDQSPVCVNGIETETECYDSGGILVISSGWMPGTHNYCVTPAFYQQDSGQKAGSWAPYDKENADAAMVKFHKADLTELDNYDKLCEGAAVKCGEKFNPKDKKHPRRRKTFVHARKNQCLTAGNLSQYGLKAGDDEHGAFDARAGNCAPIRNLSFGDVKVHCADTNDSKLSLCNPMFFDTDRKVNEKEYVGVCVAVSGHEQRDCKKAFTEKDKVHDANDKYFWDIANNGAQEAMNTMAASLNDTCKDAAIREYNCRACQMVQDHLKHDNQVLNNCGHASAGKKHKHGHAKQNGTST